jgi:hypothetical protein
MNNETLTKCICHKGFRRYSSVVARLNFGVGGQEIARISPTFQTRSRWQQAKNTLKINLNDQKDINIITNNITSC